MVIADNIFLEVKPMSITGAQIEFNCPKRTDFKRLYDYQIRKISIRYSINNGLNWYPFRPIVPVTGESSIDFSTDVDPIKLVTYTVEDATGFEPTLDSTDVLKLEFVFEMFSTNEAFAAEPNQERVYNVKRVNSTGYALTIPENPVYRVDPDTGLPTKISIIIDGIDVYT